MLVRLCWSGSSSVTKRVGVPFAEEEQTLVALANTRTSNTLQLRFMSSREDQGFVLLSLNLTSRQTGGSTTTSLWHRKGRVTKVRERDKLLILFEVTYYQWLTQTDVWWTDRERSGYSSLGYIRDYCVSRNVLGEFNFEDGRVFAFWLWKTGFWSWVSIFCDFQIVTFIQEAINGLLVYLNTVISHDDVWSTGGYTYNWRH